MRDQEYERGREDERWSRDERDYGPGYEEGYRPSMRDWGARSGESEPDWREEERDEREWEPSRRVVPLPYDEYGPSEPRRRTLARPSRDDESEYGRRYGGSGGFTTTEPGWDAVTGRTTPGGEWATPWQNMSSHADSSGGTSARRPIDAAETVNRYDDATYLPRRRGARRYGSPMESRPVAHPVPGRHSGRGPQGYRRGDDRIYEDVCERLTRDGRLDASGFEVRVENGEVTLEGSVQDRYSKRLAEDLVDTVSGVVEVHNRLRLHHVTEASERPELPAKTKPRGKSGR